MSFDNLVWIILIILAYVISTVLKNARAGSPSQENDGDKKRPGWKEKLEMYLAQVRQELESAKAGDSKEETGWEELWPQEDPGLEATDESAVSPEPAPRPVDRKERPLETSEPLRRNVYAGRMNRREETADSLKARLPGSGGAYRPKGAPYRIKDLRKAVIWSEILGPPVALRDRHPDFHGK